MSDVLLVVVDVTERGARIEDAVGAASRVEFRGPDVPRGLVAVIQRALAASTASALVVVDSGRVVPSEDLLTLADELGPGASAVAARILAASGERLVFDGGTIDLYKGPLRRGENQPAAVRHRGPTSTLWFDPRAFAISRQAAEAIVALPVERDLEALSVGWQIWRAGGRIHVATTALARSIDDAPPQLADSDEVKALVGCLLEPATLAASGIRLDGVLDRVLAGRAMIVAPRVRSDAEILAGVATAPFEAPALEQPTLTFPSSGSERRRVTLLCSDSIGPSMAGPGIRSVELARALADRFDVAVLARRVTGHVDLPGSIGEMSRDLLLSLANGRDPIVLQGPLTDWFPEVLAGTAPLAVDLYDPMNLEALEHPDAAHHVPYTVRLLVDQVARGDFFLCASERQRDYWLGMLAACGRLDVAAYQEDPDLRALIDVVPFGLPKESPRRSGPGPRDEIDGIDPNDPLFVWNGGLWDWFDPDTLLDATALARSASPDIRVLFMGVQRPGEPAPSVAAQALMQRSDELGLTGKHVFFRTWTPYETRQNTYLDATAAVSLHHAHLESRFSFRTRMLDCIWATMPILGTDGDVLAELVHEERLGVTVAPGDVNGVADALVALASDRDDVTTNARKRLAAVAPRFEWSAAAAPLAAWLDRAESRPRRAFPVLPEIPLPGVSDGAWLGPRARRAARAVRSRLA